MCVCVCVQGIHAEKGLILTKASYIFAARLLVTFLGEAVAQGDAVRSLLLLQLSGVILAVDTECLPMVNIGPIAELQAVMM